MLQSIDVDSATIRMNPDRRRLELAEDVLLVTVEGVAASVFNAVVEED